MIPAEITTTPVTTEVQAPKQGQLAQFAHTMSSTCRSIISQHSCKIVAWVGLVCFLGWVSKRTASRPVPGENPSESFKMATHLALTALNVHYDGEKSLYAKTEKVEEDKVSSFPDAIAPILSKYNHLKEIASPLFSEKKLTEELESVQHAWLDLKKKATAVIEWPALRDRLVQILDARVAEKPDALVSPAPDLELHGRLEQEYKNTKLKLEEGPKKEALCRMKDLLEGIKDGSLWQNVSLFNMDGTS